MYERQCTANDCFFRFSIFASRRWLSSTIETGCRRARYESPRLHYSVESHFFSSPHARKVARLTIISLNMLSCHHMLPGSFHLWSVAGRITSRILYTCSYDWRASGFICAKRLRRIWIIWLGFLFIETKWGFIKLAQASTYFWTRKLWTSELMVSMFTTEIKVFIFVVLIKSFLILRLDVIYVIYQNYRQQNGFVL